MTALTLEAMRSDVAEILFEDVSSLRDEENLVDRGLDSIRIMTLVARWQAVGVELAFVDLAEWPSIEAWWRLAERHIPAQ